MVKWLKVVFREEAAAAVNLLSGEHGVNHRLHCSKITFRSGEPFLTLLGALLGCLRRLSWENSKNKLDEHLLETG